MDNLLESKTVVKIINLDSEATEDGIKQLITLLVHLKGTVQNITIVNHMNGEHDYNYAYMFFQYDCDAKETVATLDGLHYRSCILNASVLDANDCSEAFSLLSKIQITKKAELLNLESSSCSSTASKEHSDEKSCISDHQSKDSVTSSSSNSNEKLSSDENDKIQHVTGETSSSVVCDEEENNESQSGSDNESDTESEDKSDTENEDESDTENEDESESSEESKMAEEPEQIIGRHYSARNDKNPSNRGCGWRGRGQGRGGRAPRSGSRYNNNNHNRDRRHNVPHTTYERSNWGHQQYRPSNRNFDTASNFFKGSNLKQSNIQNKNYPTSDTQRPQIWNIPPNFPFVPNCGPFNSNNHYPGNTQSFPNFSIPPPNFSPPVNQYNQQQNYDKTCISTESNSHQSPQNLNDNESGKNINVSISWTQQRGSQNNDDSNKPNQVTGSVCNTSPNQPLLEPGNNFTQNQDGSKPTLYLSSNNQNTYSGYIHQQSLNNANNQRRNYQSLNKNSNNSSDKPSCSSVNNTNIGHNSQRTSAIAPLKQEAVTGVTNLRPATTTSISTSSQSTVGRSAPPVPSRIKVQPTSPKIVSDSTPRSATNTEATATTPTRHTPGRTKPPVPSRIKVDLTTPTGVSCSSSTRSTASVPTALPNTGEDDEAVFSLNIGANRLSTRPSIAEKQKKEECVIL